MTPTQHAYEVCSSAILNGVIFASYFCRVYDQLDIKSLQRPITVKQTTFSFVYEIFSLNSLFRFCENIKISCNHRQFSEKTCCTNMHCSSQNQLREGKIAL